MFVQRVKGVQSSERQNNGYLGYLDLGLSCTLKTKLAITYTFLQINFFECPEITNNYVELFHNAF